MKKSSILKGAVLALLLGWAPVVPGAEFSVPLRFGMTHAMQDEHGQLLSGTAHQPGALVQILAAPLGSYPPATNGLPHTNNAVLAEARIGDGTDPELGPIGKAAGSVSINRYEPTVIFARIFNRATPEESTFYADSALYTNSTTAYAVFQIAAGPTDQPVDTGDDDGDGLNNSWERSLGSEMGSPDSDGDGVGDGDEFRAGTGLNDEASFLAMVQVAPQADGHVLVLWDAVPGKAYQLQFTTLDLSNSGQVFSNVNDVVTASGNLCSTLVTNGMSFPVGFFRIQLVE
jgi:hypothetical protein